MTLDLDGHILLSPLLLGVETFTPLINHVVSYFSDNDKAFVNVGKFPIISTYSIQQVELDPARPLRVRLVLPPNTSSSTKDTAFDN